MGRDLARRAAAGPGPRGRGRLWRASLVALLWVGAALLLAPMLAYPFGRDQGVFACGADILARGGTLYRDCWDLKPPGIYYLYWLALSLFGHTMVAPRILDLAWTLAVAAALPALGRRLMPRWAAGVAAFVFLIRYALGYDYWHTAQGDGFASLPLALACLAMVAAEERRQTRWAAACGALVGAAIAIKLTLATILALPLIAVLQRRGEPVWPRAARAAGYVGGVAVVLAGVSAYLAARGALGDMVEILFRWNAQYARLRPPAPAPLVIIYQTGRFLLGGRHAALTLIGVLALLGLAGSFRRRAERWWWLAPAWLGVMLVQVWTQGKYFEYHWLPCLPPLALLTALGVSTTWELVKRYTGDIQLARVLATAGLALAAGALLAAYRAHFALAVGYGLGRVPATTYLSSLNDPRGDFSITADLEAAALLRGRPGGDEPLFVWGFEPILYFLTERPPASRFVSHQPLVAPWSPRDWRQELLRDLAQRRPAHIVVAHRDVMPWVTLRPYDSAQELSFFPELDRLLRARYRLHAQVEDLDIWERRDLARP